MAEEPSRKKKRGPRSEAATERRAARRLAVASEAVLRDSFGLPAVYSKPPPFSCRVLDDLETIAEVDPKCEVKLLHEAVDKSGGHTGDLPHWDTWDFTESATTSATTSSSATALAGSLEGDLQRNGPDSRGSTDGASCGNAAGAGGTDSASRGNAAGADGRTAGTASGNACGPGTSTGGSGHPAATATSLDFYAVSLNDTEESEL